MRLHAPLAQMLQQDMHEAATLADPSLFDFKGLKAGPLDQPPVGDP